MPILHTDYVPILKFRQGEYQALFRLSAAQKANIVPLFEVTPPEYDFELEQPAKSLDDHLRKFGARVETKWGVRPALVDAGFLDPAARMIGGVHPLASVFEDLRDHEANCIPVTTLTRDADYQEAVRDIAAIDQAGVCLRLSFDEAGDPDLAANVEAFLDGLELPLDELDIVLDLQSPNFLPIDGLATLIGNLLTGNDVFDGCRSLVLAATAFPSAMSDLALGIGALPRHEWLLYKAVIEGAEDGMRIPAFGDYAIAAPDLVTGDMRLLKPSASVRYTVDDAWIVCKGPNVRDNGFGQYTGLCLAVSADPRYLGHAFSMGSAYVYGCGHGTESTGNLTTWRWVGTNHHLAKVVHDLATFYAP
jgi:hypothetical protein